MNVRSNRPRHKVHRALSVDPRGEVEGLLLADGPICMSPPVRRTAAASSQAWRSGAGLWPACSSGRIGTTRCDQKSYPGTTFIVPVRLDLPLPEQESRLSVTELYASGTIRVLLYHPFKHVVQGIILSDGTQVRLPLDASEELRRSFHVGDTVTVRGNGTLNQFGRAIEALAIGRDPGSLSTLDASLHRLP